MRVSERGRNGGMEGGREPEKKPRCKLISTQLPQQSPRLGAGPARAALRGRARSRADSDPAAVTLRAARGAASQRLPPHRPARAVPVRRGGREEPEAGVGAGPQVRGGQAVGSEHAHLPVCAARGLGQQA